MSYGSDSHMEFLGAPRCTPYYLALVTRMTRFRERAPVNLRALGKLSSMAPREWGQCVGWVRWGAEVGRSKGTLPSTSRFPFSVFLEVGSEEDVFSFHVVEVFGHLLGGRGQVDMVMDDAGWVVFLRGGEMAYTVGHF